MSGFMIRCHIYSQRGCGRGSADGFVPNRVWTRRGTLNLGHVHAPVMRSSASGRFVSEGDDALRKSRLGTSVPPMPVRTRRPRKTRQNVNRVAGD